MTEPASQHSTSTISTHTSPQNDPSTTTPSTKDQWETHSLPSIPHRLHEWQPYVGFPSVFGHNDKDNEDEPKDGTYDEYGTFQTVITNNPFYDTLPLHPQHNPPLHDSTHNHQEITLWTTSSSSPTLQFESHRTTFPSTQESSTTHDDDQHRPSTHTHNHNHNQNNRWFYSLHPSHNPTQGDCLVRLNLGTYQWERLTPHRSVICAKYASLLVNRGYVYVFGGQTTTTTTTTNGNHHHHPDVITNQSSSVSTAARYCIATGIWDDLPPLPYPRHGAAVLGVEDGIYLMGGRCSSGGSSTGVGLDHREYDGGWEDGMGGGTVCGGGGTGGGGGGGEGVDEEEKEEEVGYHKTMFVFNTTTLLWEQQGLEFDFESNPFHHLHHPSIESVSHSTTSSITNISTKPNNTPTNTKYLRRVVLHNQNPNQNPNQKQQKSSWERKWRKQRGGTSPHRMVEGTTTQQRGRYGSIRKTQLLTLDNTTPTDRSNNGETNNEPDTVNDASKNNILDSSDASTEETTTTTTTSSSSATRGNNHPISEHHNYSRESYVSSIPLVVYGQTAVAVRDRYVLAFWNDLCFWFDAGSIVTSDNHDDDHDDHDNNDDGKNGRNASSVDTTTTTTTTPTSTTTTTTTKTTTKSRRIQWKPCGGPPLRTPRIFHSVTLLSDTNTPIDPTGKAKTINYDHHHSPRSFPMSTLRVALVGGIVPSQRTTTTTATTTTGTWVDETTTQNDDTIPVRTIETISIDALLSETNRYQNQQQTRKHYYSSSSHHTITTFHHVFHYTNKRHVFLNVFFGICAVVFVVGYLGLKRWRRWYKNAGTGVCCGDVVRRGSRWNGGGGGGGSGNSGGERSGRRYRYRRGRKTCHHKSDVVDS